MKKAFSAILFIILFSLTVTVFSCQSNNTQNQSDKNEPGPIETAADQPAEAQAETEDLLAPALPDEDFGGYVFRVISRGDDWHSYPVHTRDIIAEKENGDMCGKTVQV